MMPLGLILFVMTCLFIALILAQFTLIQEFSENLYDPYEILAIDDNHLLVSDYTNKDQILYLLDVSNNTIINHIPTGQGPGEIAPEGLKLISRFSNGNVLVWDSVLFRGAVFDEQLNYLHDISSGTERISHGMLIDHHSLVSVHFSPNEDFISIYELDNQSIGQLKHTIKTTDHDLLRPLADNHLLRQGPSYHKDAVVYGIRFSTVLLNIGTEGITYVTSEPLNHPIPEGYQPDGNTYTAPSVFNHPFGFLDVTADEHFIYALISEETGSKFKNLLNTLTGNSSRIHEMLETLSHSDRLLLFDINTGDYITEITLPKQAKSIEFSDQHMFLVNALGDEVVIQQYLKPDF